MFKTIIATAAVVSGIAIVATGAAASSSQMTDAQYLSAVRCQALMSSAALGKGDTAGIAAVVRSQSAGRLPEVFDRADQVRDDAMRQASHADASGRAALIAERNGACQAWASNGGSHMASTSSQPSGAN